MTTERRKTSRLNVRLPVSLFPSDGSAVLKTETVDISADGFYCIAGEPLAPRSQVRFLIALPVTDGSGPQLYMDGMGVVVRVICQSNTGFGLGFHIDEYHVTELDHTDPMGAANA